MFALTLAAALYGLDAEVRQSEAFALAGELGRFPPPAVVTPTIAGNRQGALSVGGDSRHGAVGVRLAVRAQQFTWRTRTIEVRAPVCSMKWHFNMAERLLGDYLPTRPKA
jgi:hypothetical protein